MKGHPQVVQMLNDILVTEVTTVNQYFLAAKIADHQGYQRLGHHLYRESVGEMKHAEKLVERILYLEGLPNLQKLDKVRVAGTVIEQLQVDLDTERQSVAQLNRGIDLARQQADHGTAELLEDLLEDAEQHVDWLESQAELLRQVGAAHYLAQQIKKDG
jgi:bacterioferritin